MKLLDMEQGASINQIKKTIRNSFDEQGIKSSLIGVLFAPPTSFIKSEIVDSFEYFHYRSERIINFFWVGYEQADENDSKKIFELNKEFWKFNPYEFNKLRNEFENETRWIFSGESDLLLFTATSDESELIAFDFADAIVINLEKAKEEKAISSVRGLFEIVFSISQKLKKENSSLKLSGQLIIHAARTSAFSLLVSFLPNRFQKDINTVYAFCTENIKKSTEQRL
ncbi:MAG: hypothetical protein A2X10_01870 [Bacteroidetes bacterium GWA2_33_15]|nr:MAG: hypothetical protein A2X10_01870 [Bacteroidetes bacterium GWA2_33_15]OFX68606.1 MAG: hypothetical protein A2X14_14680 [Bacteroidetes bacterium GWD2_33_33]